MEPAPSTNETDKTPYMAVYSDNGSIQMAEATMNYFFLSSSDVNRYLKGNQKYIRLIIRADDSLREYLCDIESSLTYY